MKVLIVGNGGREHALAWKMAQSPKVQQVYVAPGNGGTARDKTLINVPITDVKALRQWAQDNQIVLTVVGPEAPLAAGVVDEFRAHSMRIFGPTQAAAQLESSKAFSKAFMRATTSRQPSSTPSPTRWRLTLMWTAWAHPSWSRPTAWLLARAWWWP